jgi:molybdopterin-guanine dinucleotide biosynthesis protein A
MTEITKNDITAVILAGGKSSRMNNEDKGLMLLNNKAMISYIFDIIQENVNNVLISSNRNIEKYQKYAQVISDNLADFQGPLAGISKALSETKTPYLLIAPCDCPFINQILIDRLVKAMQKHQCDVCVAFDGEKIQPTLALIKSNLKNNLDDFLLKGQRKLGLWLTQQDIQKVDLSDEKEIFVNFNSPQDFKTHLKT